MLNRQLESDGPCDPLSLSIPADMLQILEEPHPVDMEQLPKLLLFNVSLLGLVHSQQGRHACVEHCAKIRDCSCAGRQRRQMPGAGG